MCLRAKKCLACLIAAEKRGFIGDSALVIFSLHSAGVLPGTVSLLCGMAEAYMRRLCSLKRCVLTLIRVSFVVCQRAVSDVATCFVLNVHAPKCIALGVCVREH